jgi:hypothetical protein
MPMVPDTATQVSQETENTGGVTHLFFGDQTHGDRGQRDEPKDQ